MPLASSGFVARMPSSGKKKRIRRLRALSHVPVKRRLSAEREPEENESINSPCACVRSTRTLIDSVVFAPGRNPISIIRVIKFAIEPDLHLALMNV